MKRLGTYLPNVWGHWLSATGTILTTVSGLTLVALLVTDWAGSSENVYSAGIMLFVLPALFVLGLVLIPIGLWRRRKARPEGQEPRSAGEALAETFQTPRGRRKVGLILGLTAVNLVILAMVGHRSKTYMDSPMFCGTACHTVMEPEYATYVASPHARVACVDCHIGPGASFAVKSKIDGLRQVWRTLLDTYDRPVPTPVHTLRPSRDTCEQCHWPDKFHGKSVLQRVKVEPDEDNTHLVSLLLLHVGGLDEARGIYEGIHWHVSPDHEVRYEALDEKREVIGTITVLEHGEVVRVYRRVVEEGETLPVAVETRTMDCIDCHNRPTHIFDRSPAAALDRAFGEGRLDPSVPWLKAVAEPLLGQEGLDRATAGTRFRQDLEAAYRADHPEQVPTTEVLDAAAKVLAELWLYNVYPERAVTWGTYVSHLGHQGETPERHGCFRCHGTAHKDENGKSPSQSCTLCHDLLAAEEEPDDLDEAAEALLTMPR